MQRGEGDALDGGGVLGGGALVQFGDEVGEGGVRLGGAEVLGEPGQRGEGLPAVPGGTGADRCLGAPAGGGEDGAYLGGEVVGQVESGVVAAEAGGAAQRGLGLADLAAFEEALGSTELVGDARVGEGLLVQAGLSVGAEEDRDLAAWGRPRR